MPCCAGEPILLFPLRAVTIRCTRARMPNAHWLPLEWFVVYITIAWCIRAGMVPVVLRRELAPGAAIAWLGIVFLHPYIGLALYMTVGETRLGARRANEHRQLAERFRL